MSPVVSSSTVIITVIVIGSYPVIIVITPIGCTCIIARVTAIGIYNSCTGLPVTLGSGSIIFPSSVIVDHAAIAVSGTD